MMFPMIKQPLVTLNTSVHEVPSQSLESFGDHGSETGQVLLSTGNDREVVKIAASRKEGGDELAPNEHGFERVGDIVVSKPKTWVDQVEKDEEVSDSEEQRDEDSLLSSSSPTVPKNNIATVFPKTKLSPLAPAFMLSNKTMISAHDRALWNALDNPKPLKFALSAGEQLLQSPGHTV